MDRYARRRVAVLLVAVLAVFGLSTSAQVTAVADGDAPQVHVLTVATPPAPGLPVPHGTPDLPLTEADPVEHVVPAGIPVSAHDATDTPPRAHRQPAADRAPPAR